MHLFNYGLNIVLVSILVFVLIQCVQFGHFFCTFNLVHVSLNYVEFYPFR